MAPGMSRAGATAGATSGVISGATPSWPGATRNGASIEAVAPGREHGFFDTAVQVAQSLAPV